MRGRLQETSVLPERLSVEHVMPRSWKEHWPLADGTEATRDDFLRAIFEITEDESAVGQIVRRDRLKHSVGNLTLVTTSFNSKVSNKGFETKRVQFADQSILMLNKDIARESNWDEGRIEGRSERISELAKEIWPVPVVVETANQVPRS